MFYSHRRKGGPRLVAGAECAPMTRVAVFSAIFSIAVAVVFTIFGLRAPAWRIVEEITQQVGGLVIGAVEERQSPAAPPMTADEIAWLPISRSSDSRSFQIFVEKFPTSRFAPEAYARIRELRPVADTVPAGQANPSGVKATISPAAEAASKAAVQQEEVRRRKEAEDERKRVADIQAQQKIDAEKRRTADIEAQRRADADAQWQAVASQFSLFKNTAIESNASTGSFWNPSGGGRRGLVSCMTSCLRAPGCRAFTSDEWTCRLYGTPVYVVIPNNGDGGNYDPNAPELQLVVNKSGWLSGIMR
jgi:hypothetical protein